MDDNPFLVGPNFVNNPPVITRFQRPDHLRDEIMPVVTPLFNSPRFRTRWKHYEDFALRVERAGGTLFTIEVAFGNRAFALEPGPRVIQMRVHSELWLKENAINVAVQFVTEAIPGWTKIAWVDADVRFVRDDWMDETKQQLEHYDVVQMWSQFIDVDANYEAVRSPTPSFMKVYRAGGPRGRRGRYYGRYPGAPGLAWAARRSAWDTLGGLLDVTILGAGDWYMAHALVGELDGIINTGNHPQYVRALETWGERAVLLRKNVGYVPGLAVHYWHGPKVHRKYGTREQILIEEQFDPTRHITRNAGGLYEFTDYAPITLRDRIRGYFHERNEDA
jgi:hypothetical protein